MDLDCSLTLGLGLGIGGGTTTRENDEMSVSQRNVNRPPLQYVSPGNVNGAPLQLDLFPLTPDSGSGTLTWKKKTSSSIGIFVPGLTIFKTNR